MEENKNNELIIKDFGELNNRVSNAEIFTNIEDPKIIFNLENRVDYKINDCKGEAIRIKNVLIKKIEKKLDEPEIDENGEIIKEKELKMITILVDENNFSYVTASKTFAFDLIKYINMFGISSVEGLEIKISEKSVKNSNNKALTFELI